ESDNDNNSRVTIIPRYIRGHLPVGKNGKIGIINQYGKLVVPVEYERVMFCDAYFCVRNFKEQTTMFSYDGKQLCADIDNFQVLSEGLIAVKKDGKWGYIDASGKIVIPFLFDEVTSFQYGIAKVKHEKTHYTIDRNGNELTDGEVNFTDDLLDKNIKTGNRYDVKPFMQDKSEPQLWGVVDNNEKVIIKPQYLSLQTVMFRGKPFFVVTQDEPKRFGLIDVQGNCILPIIYKNIFSRDGDSTLKVMTVDEKQGLFHLSGYWILPIEYNDFGSLSEGLRWVCLGKKCGYVDEVGTLVIPTKYDWAEDFQNGVAAVGVGTMYFAYELLGGKWGYIDHGGKWIWEPSDEP
ncbi:MAG: WG repeat-containing protein, partial [Planctomycetaceae bacterium]|nr:WG repeat-containing protein [Planctomycetaceae bacterium]